MADLSKPAEAASWILAWKAEGARGQKRINEAAEQMRLSLNGCEVDGRFPSGWKADDVRQAVKFLERAAAVKS